MHFHIKLSEEASSQYIQIRSYLVYEFGEYVADNFKEKLTDVFELISKNPHLFPFLNKAKVIRRAVITKEVSVYYQIVKTDVYILSIIDNRREQPNF